MSIKHAVEYVELVPPPSNTTREKFNATGGLVKWIATLRCLRSALSNKGLLAIIDSRASMPTNIIKPTPLFFSKSSCILQEIPRILEDMQRFAKTNASIDCRPASDHRLAQAITKYNTSSTDAASEFFDLPKDVQFELQRKFEYDVGAREAQYLRELNYQPLSLQLPSAARAKTVEEDEDLYRGRFNLLNLNHQAQIEHALFSAQSHWQKTHDKYFGACKEVSTIFMSFFEEPVVDMIRGLINELKFAEAIQFLTRYFIANNTKDDAASNKWAEALGWSPPAYSLGTTLYELRNQLSDVAALKYSMYLVKDVPKTERITKSVDHFSINWELINVNLDTSKTDDQIMTAYPTLGNSAVLITKDNYFDAIKSVFGKHPFNGFKNCLKAFSSDESRLSTSTDDRFNRLTRYLTEADQEWNTLIQSTASSASASASSSSSSSSAPSASTASSSAAATDKPAKTEKGKNKRKGDPSTKGWSKAPKTANAATGAPAPAAPSAPLYYVTTQPPPPQYYLPAPNAQANVAQAYPAPAVPTANAAATDASKPRHPQCEQCIRIGWPPHLAYKHGAKDHRDDYSTRGLAKWRAANQV